MPRFHLLPSSSRRAFAAALGASLALGLGAPAAIAQSYPSKPITLIVPFAAGGGVDATARLVNTKLGEVLKQSVVIDNVAGAAGTIGTQKAARAPADGYTLLFAVASPLNVAPLVAPAAVRYDTFKDFAPIATVGVSPFVLIGKSSLPAASMAELIALAKKEPGKLNFGTDGVGTSLHVTAELIKQRAAMDIVHVPYKSGPQVLTDVAGGQLDLAVLPLSLAQPFIKDGKVKAFGVTSRQRAAIAPNVPALAETAALKDFEVDSWLGILAPAGVPAPVAQQLMQAVETTMKDPEVVRRLGEIAVRPVVMTGPAFADYLAKERRTVQDVVTKANIKAE
ncbi:MAG: tripartite tricarboxylate transporter substrate binding protein [Rhodocyclaceae bacterium]|nr:tripartite tricarboxylate transporter substrate binding protein [Pseudomonadota bacterium]MDQ7972090.1 tripartite tricarboxylate transporter substrate binding protein [Rhodocyclaceae bacterium]MDQ8002001.1 tripartite tricarboxylate transporter substrate binding protein [Pseudomonadota bacterium]MDQ8019103.1 tripartite tricarboxylate transporter substrate binding protein [Pseudomonadota bacterium]